MIICTWELVKAMTARTTWGSESRRSRCQTSDPLLSRASSWLSPVSEAGGNLGSFSAQTHKDDFTIIASMGAAKINKGIFEMDQ